MPSVYSGVKVDEISVAEPVIFSKASRIQFVFVLFKRKL
jgi:hypothetical protein